MPGKLISVPFISQMEDMDKYISEYRSLKRATKCLKPQHQFPDRLNQQVKPIGGVSHVSNNNGPQRQQNNRKKYNSGTAFTQTNNHNMPYRQQNVHKYNQQSQNSVTSIYNKSVQQQKSSSNLYSGNLNPGYTDTYNNARQDTPSIFTEVNGYETRISNDSNSGNTSTSSLNNLNMSSGSFNSQMHSHGIFSPASSVTPPPIMPSRLPSTLSSASIGSSVSNDMDFMMPLDMKGTRSIGQHQNRFMQQQQPVPNFNPGFVEPSFSQNTGFINPLMGSSSLVTDLKESNIPYAANPYSSDSLTTSFMFPDTNTGWNTNKNSQANFSSSSIWNSDMSVWS